jgi:hypothetical protein
MSPKNCSEMRFVCCAVRHFLWARQRKVSGEDRTKRAGSVLLCHCHGNCRLCRQDAPYALHSVRSSVTGRSVGLCRTSASLPPFPFPLLRRATKISLPLLLPLEAWKQARVSVRLSDCCACPHRVRLASPRLDSPRSG